MTTETKERRLLEAAWGIIANAGNVNDEANVGWHRESTDWQQAAKRWRDEYHTHTAELKGE